MLVKRRDFFRSAALLGVSHPLLQAFSLKQNPFLHGVASGDPLSNRVILWTRISPLFNKSQEADQFSGSINYRWIVASDPQLENIIQQGAGQTQPERDFTVKVDVTGLSPDTSYYYRFYALGFESDIGRTKTLPIGHVEQARFAVCSCANYASGYFHAYADMARHAELDAVIHLGDYLYEYGLDEYDQINDRIPLPTHETRTLQDYRIRHSQYKTDRDLQEAHRQHPFICIWDDHEFANDAWLGGAENHSPEEGSWQQRKQAAIQAYFEWMPIRENANNPDCIYRQFQFGDLLDLCMLDTRIAGRDQQTRERERETPQRSLLGEQQEAWLFSALSESHRRQQTWRVIGQQVMMAQLGSNALPLNFDQWDGYPACRQRLFNHLRHNNINNVIVLTGDIHSSWANELCSDPYADNEQGETLAVEFITPAITSPGITDRNYAENLSATIKHLMPHIKYQDFYHRGYLLLDINHQRCQADWYHLDDVSTTGNLPQYNASMQCLTGEATLQHTDLPITLQSYSTSSATLAPKSLLTRTA